jgi:tetratricopeptide (TPR) repeat protein
MRSLRHAPAPVLAGLALGLALALAPAAATVPVETSAFRQALAVAERSLESGDLPKARESIQRALERDRRSCDAWRLRARWAAAAGDADERVYATHQLYRLSVAQGAPKDQLAALKAELVALDPIAADLLGLKQRFLARLQSIAERYEKDGRPHSAIRVHKRILSLDPEMQSSRDAIERIASAPDPSLAGEAKPKDLFADVTREWIAKFDAEHADWKDRAKLEHPSYITYTDAGYEVLVRVAEAMEQVNAFYRVFFHHGTKEDGGSVPRINVNIFKNRDEYLTLGVGPPIKWSGGHFTGTAVETYIPDQGGFEEMTGTLFHEAAHQFVSLATNASGWLNEGLASFFEGTRMLPNGTVLMNLPADHRLFPLAARMEKGWMSGPADGIDAKDPDVTPQKAPRFRTVLEDKYEWGPPWYAPTWGVVYFLYNYQDPVDGRYVYRAAFHEFVDKSGGRIGEGAVKNFEEVVLANPEPPIKGVDREGALDVRLPRTVEELDDVWKAWCLRLRDERQGKVEAARPYKLWARYAAANKDYDVALEHFEKGLVETPEDPELLREFAALLLDHFDNADRAAKLTADAIRILERAEPPDEKAIEDAERLLVKIDPQQETLAKVEKELAEAARGIVGRYQEAELPMMVMDVAWRLGSELGISELFAAYEEALRSSGRSLDIWELAYDEESLAGWNAPGQAAGTAGAFHADGTFLDADFGIYDAARFDFQTLALDKVASGDFSMEARVEADRGKINFAGFVFGMKDPQTFHGYLLFPGKAEAGDGTAGTGFVDLMSSFGGQTKTWRHVPVETAPEEGRSTAGTWYTLRLDVSGRFVDLWFDGDLVASHEFSSVDVLRGRFGLVTGPGSVRFRDVRYLARDPRDPGARIERAVHVGGLRSQGEPVGGSYQGLVPPFPTVERWAQGGASSWAEAGRVPQLLVFFSIQQNDLIGIDAWLTDLARRTEDVGLRVVSICSPNDGDAIDAYLKEHPFPGAVGVDKREGTGIGESFERFFIRRFNLPRLLLLDVDGKVVWEGDPGFERGVGWDRSVGSFLDDPLDELIATRKLRALRAWLAAWTETAEPALARGDLPAALETLQASADLDAGSAPEVATAQQRWTALNAALDDLPRTADALAAKEAEPAFGALLDWAQAMGRPADEGQLKKLRKVLSSRDAKDWDKVAEHVDRYKKAKKSPEENAAALLERLERLKGAVADGLAADLRSALDSSDLAAFDRVVDASPGRPAAWLAHEYFGW